MGENQLSRRETMRKTGAAVGAATLVGSAGCLDSIPFVGGATYKQWLPGPGTLSDADHYRFRYFDLSTIADNEDEFSDDTVGNIENVEQLWAPVDVDWDDAEWFLFTDNAAVAKADYDQDSAEDDLDGEDYDDDSDYEGYTIWLGPRERRGVAVDGNHIITNGFRGSDDPVDDLEAIIDTKKGNEDRYADESDDMNELIGALGDGTIVSGETTEDPDSPNPERGQFGDMVAKGRKVTVNGSTSKLEHVVVYDSSSDVDEGDLEDWVEANEDSDEEFEDVDDINYNTNGRKGIVKGTSDTDDL